MRYKIFTEKEWAYLCSRINWGASGMDADAIQIMNKQFDTKEPVQQQFE